MIRWNFAAIISFKPRQAVRWRNFDGRPAMYGCFKSAAGMIIAGAIAVAGSASGVGAAGANEGPSPKTFHLPEVSFHYTDDTLPAIYRTATVRRFDNTPADNPITDAGATLGRVL